MKNFILSSMLWFFFSSVLLVLYSIHEDNTVVGMLSPAESPSFLNGLFSNKEGPPHILLKYDNNIYQGLLRTAIFSAGDEINYNMSSFAYPNHNSITTTVPEQIININQNRQIQFVVYNSPIPVVNPSSLSVTAYHANGTVYKTLSLVQDTKKDKFTADLNKGEYILLAVATWLPNHENYLSMSGYVTFAFRVNVL